MSSEKFGNYQVIRRIAVGGMGEIFLARQIGVHGFERLAVIKTVLEGPTEEPDRREMFLTEARVAALLNHPNIVQVYDLGEQDGTLYMAMEYVEGETLARVSSEARRQGRLLKWPFVDACIQAARALHHAHQLHDSEGRALQMVHRDISPQNIMVRLDGEVKVVDFGIAKVANASLRTRTGMFKGKPAYMAPEQVQRREVDRRADIFALGVVLWELCTGRRMFPEMGDYDVLTQAIDKPRPPPSSVASDFPRELEAVIMRALELDPDKRFQDARELADALDALLKAAPDDENPHLGQYVENLVGAQVRSRHHADNADAGFVPAKADEPSQATTTPERQRPDTSPPSTARPDTLAATVPGRMGARTGSPSSRAAAARAAWAPIAVVGVAAAAMVALFTSGSVQQGSVMDSEVAEQSRAAQPRWNKVVVEEKLPEPEETGASSSSSELPHVERTPAKPRAAPVVTTAGSSGAVPQAADTPKPVQTATTGFVTIGSEPWSLVTLDGVTDLGSTPIVKAELPVGEHTLLMVNKAAQKQKTVKVTVLAGRHIKVRENLE